MSHGLSLLGVGPRVLTAIVVLTLGLTAALPCRSLCAEPAANQWIGQRVVPKRPDFTLRDTEEGPARSAKIAIYRVDRVDGGFLQVKAEGGSSGWTEAARVVPVDQANAYFSRAIQESPRDPHNHTMRAIVLLFERDDAQHALADCERALQLDPKNALAHGIRGAARAATQDFSRALADFSEVIRLRPGDPDAYSDRGVARMSSQDLDGAIADFNEAIRLDPKDSATFVSRAAVWLSRKENAKAIADFDQAIRLNPNNADAYFLRATARGQNGDLDHAIADYTQLIKLDPQVPLAFEARGTAYRHKQEFGRAIADFDAAIRLDPNVAGFYIARGLAWHDQRQNDKAIADLDQALKLDPENPAAYGIRGGAWAGKKELDKAIADFSRLIQLEPTNAWAYSSRGLALAELKRFDKAIADLDRALELDPENPDALNGCAWFRATCPVATFRDGALARKTATKACELTGWQQPGLLDTLAAAHAESGDFASAVKCQSKAIELETDANEKAEFGDRLKLYKEKKPYRETKP
jgi:tetratricopeptide (TPR) repeat protein